MKQKLFILLLFLVCAKGLSQNARFSLEANFPILIDDNFLAETSEGILDLGFKYRILKTNFARFGISLNITFLNERNEFDPDDAPVNISIKTLLLQPKVFTEFDIRSAPKLHPFFGIGYTSLTMNISGSAIGVDIPGGTDNKEGVSINLGFAYDIFTNVFFNLEYDFTRLSANSPTTSAGNNFNTKINILKLGLGLRF